MRPSSAESTMTKPRKAKTPRVRRPKVRCVYCGRVHELRVSYVGYEERALCKTCEGENLAVDD